MYWLYWLTAETVETMETIETVCRDCTDCTDCRDCRDCRDRRDCRDCWDCWDCKTCWLNIWKKSLTDFVTTWKQEMLAHLKRPLVCRPGGGAKGCTESVHRNVTFFYDGLPESDELLLDFYPKYTFMCHQGIFFLTFLAVKFQDKRSIVQSVGHEISNIPISDKTNSEMFIQVSAIKTRSKYGAKNVTVWVRE